MPSRTSLIIIAALCTVGGGCASDEPVRTSGAPLAPAAGDTWRAPITFTFSSLTRDDAVKVERVFQSEKLLYRRTGDNPLAYEVRGLSSGADLARVNKQLSASTEANVQAASVSFGPSASVANFAPVAVKVTPGSAAYIADGQGGTPWRRVYVDPTGQWKGMVYLKGAVAKQGGWLYIAAVKDGLTSYHRLNPSTHGDMSVTLADFKLSHLPEPGKAGTVQTARGENDESPWPWD